MIKGRNAAISVTDFVAGYGNREILHGIAVEVYFGEIVAVIGHNGAGKSTLLKAMFGILPTRAGKVFVAGEQVKNVSPRQMISRRVSYLPQGNRVFGDLTVSENLQMGGYTVNDSTTRSERIGELISIFPQLRDRLRHKAGTLSGGQRQVLALAMALVSDPQIMLLDEPSLGLAPPLARESLRYLRKLCKSRGIGVLVVEQKVREILNVADRAIVLRDGRVTYAGPVDPLRDLDRLRDVYF